jgi:hypothetical protein
MKAITLLFALFMTLSLSAYSNGDGETSAEVKKSCSIEGSVADMVSGEMLVGALVEIVGTDIKVYTDFDGIFEINNLKAGTYNLIISYISYNKSYVENVSLTVGVDQKLSVSLTR